MQHTSGPEKGDVGAVDHSTSRLGLPCAGVGNFRKQSAPQLVSSMFMACGPYTDTRCIETRAQVSSGAVGLCLMV